MPEGVRTGHVEPSADVVLSAEVTGIRVERVPAYVARIGKRVVTELRTITVEVRREELYVERTPAVASDGASDLVPAAEVHAEPVLTLVLHEEVPEIVNRVVAVERVRVFVETLEGQETVATELRREEAELLEETSPSPTHIS